MFAREYTFDEFATRLDEAGNRLVSGDFSKALYACAKIIQNDTRDRLRRGVDPDGRPNKPTKYPPLVGPSARATPLWATGRLAASCSAGGEGNVTSVTKFVLAYGTNLEYAAIHQFGGIIKPNRAKKLTIPLTREAAKYAPREFPRKLFVPRGKKILAESRMKRLVAHYALVDSVEIPARPFIGLGNDVLRKCEDVLLKHAEREVLKALGG